MARKECQQGDPLSRTQRIHDLSALEGPPAHRRANWTLWIMNHVIGPHQGVSSLCEIGDDVDLLHIKADSDVPIAVESVATIAAKVEDKVEAMRVKRKDLQRVLVVEQEGNLLHVRRYFPQYAPISIFVEKDGHAGDAVLAQGQTG